MLEEESFHGRPRDYVTMLLMSGLIMLVSGDGNSVRTYSESASLAN